jgi:hypothetical protein
MESPGGSIKQKNILQSEKSSNPALSAVMATDAFDEMHFCYENSGCTTPTNRATVKSDLKRLASCTTADSPKKLSGHFSGSTKRCISTEDLEQILTRFAPQAAIASFIDDSDGEDGLLLPQYSFDLLATTTSIVQIFEGMFAPESFQDDLQLHERLQKKELTSIKGSLTTLSNLDLVLKSEPLAHRVDFPSRDEFSIKDPKIPSLSPDPSSTHSLVFYDRFSDQPYASLHKRAGIELYELDKESYLQILKEITLAGLSLVFSQFSNQSLKQRYKSFLSQPNQYFSNFESPFGSQASSLFLRGIKHNPADLNYLSTYVSLILAFFRLYHDLLAYFIRLLSSKERNSHIDRFHLLYFSLELESVKMLNGKFCNKFFSEVKSDYPRK